MLTAVNQNNPVPPPIFEEEDPIGDQPIGMTTYLVNTLKEKCEELGKASSKTNETKWILLAVGISLFVLGSAFLGAAFATSNLLLGKIGIYLIPASVLSFAAIPLFTPPDYHKIKELVDADLIDFADKDKSDLKIMETGKIQLRPDNILMYSEVKRLANQRASTTIT